MILEVNKLRKEVSSGDSELTILDDVSFSLEEGQSLAITGPSGSGKSTLLGLLAGLDTATRGEIYIDKVGLHKLDEEDRATLRKEKVGFVFQSFELLPSLTALENVMLPSELKSEDNPKENAEYFLKRVGLSEREHHYPNQLSGGEQQRVNIARGMGPAYPGLLLDEPTASLDPENRETVLNLVKGARDQGAAIIGIFHDKMARDLVCDREIDLTDLSGSVDHG